MREWGGLYRGGRPLLDNCRRGKRSVTLDLRRSEGQQVLRELARAADVVIENFRPGTLEVGE